MFHDHAFAQIVGMSQDEKAAAVLLLDNMTAVLALSPDGEVPATVRLLTTIRGVVATAHHAARPAAATTDKEAVR
jgi:hypothetical protein